MKPMSLNLKEMKKVKEDEHSASFAHPKGHTITIAKGKLPALQRKQIESLPIHMAKGGSVEDIVNNATDASLDVPTVEPKDPSKKYAGEYEKIYGQLRSGQPGAPDKFLRDQALSTVESMRDADSANARKSAAAETMNAQKINEENERRQSLGLPLQSIPSTSAGRVASNSAEIPPPVIPPMPNSNVPAQGGTNNIPLPGSGGFNLQGAYNQGQRAISEQQAVDEQKSKEMEKLQTADMARRENDYQSFQQNIQKGLDQQKAFMNDYMAGHINPKHYMESLSAPQKVGTAIGLLLGGIGGGLLKTGGNVAMDFLNKQIDRDIDAQKSELEKRRTILGANRELMGDMVMAHNATRINMNDIYDHKIQLAASKLGTPQAKAAADMAHANFAIQNATLMKDNANRQVLLSKLSKGATNVDPAQLVPHLVPQHHQKEVFEEIQRAQDTKRMAKAILGSFDQAVNENTVVKTGAGLLRTPPGVYGLHQSLQPTFKDLEGTVRQAAMDNTFKNVTPMPGDLPSTVRSKRKNLEEYLVSKASAPTAKGYGIDLSQFESTQPVRSPSDLEGKTATNAKGQRIVMKSGRWVPVGQ